LPGRAGHAAGPPQDWAADTSGFGATLPPAPAGAAPAGPERPWYSPRRWRNA
jgi:hypothetical protein